jgi:hypothetical protein
MCAYLEIVNYFLIIFTKKNIQFVVFSCSASGPEFTGNMSMSENKQKDVNRKKGLKFVRHKNFKRNSSPFTPLFSGIRTFLPILMKEK